MISILLKFKEERNLHSVYKAFKTLNVKLVVDQKNLLMKVESQLTMDDVIKFANVALSDEDQGSFNVKEV